MPPTRSSEALAESRVVSAFSITGTTRLEAGSSSSMMPSSLATMGWACSMTSFAEVVSLSMSRRAERMVSATSTAAHTPATASTTSAICR